MSYAEMWERNRESLKSPYNRRIDTSLGISRILMTPILFGLMVDEKLDQLEKELREVKR